MPEEQNQTAQAPEEEQNETAASPEQERPANKWRRHVLNLIPPERLRDRPKDENGNIATYVTLIVDGQPVLGLIDPAVQDDCWKHRLCGACGQPLTEEIYIIMAEQNVEHRWATDAIMHEDCARFTAQACPYMALPNYRQVREPRPPKGYKLEEWEKAPRQRPEQMVFYITDGYDPTIREDRHGKWVVANEPLDIEKFSTIIL